MKEKKIILLTALFFLIINTSYFWEPQLGLLVALVMLILFFYYLALIIIFFQQLIQLFKLKFRSKSKILITGSLLVVLIATSMRPNGIIDFDRLAGNDLLIAGIEGSANCTTLLKLKNNHTFIQRDICFGINEIKGSYELKGDTIFFKNVHPGRTHDLFYSYAVVKNAGELVMYKNGKDSLRRLLFIKKNVLFNFTPQPAQAP